VGGSALRSSTFYSSFFSTNIVRIVLFGDGAWAAHSLKALSQSGRTVVAVVVRFEPSDPELQMAAEQAGIPVMQPAKVNDEAFLCRLRELSPDLGISIAYNQIFRAAKFAFLPQGIINFHAGKLPYYRGRNVLNWAILNGEKEIGLTSHLVDDGIDTGPIVLQTVLPIAWTDGYGDVLCKIIAAFPRFVLESVDAIESGKADLKPQPGGEGTYFPGRGPDDEWIDWNDTSFNLHNKVRAITRPGPGAKTLLGDAEIRIWRAFYDPKWSNYIATPGVVVGRNPSGVIVKTGDSVLRIEEVQVCEKPPEVPNWAIGTRLGVNPVCLYNVLSRQLRQIEALRFKEE
jgi:methionyl-tRNA formyltransferase